MSKTKKKGIFFSLLADNQAVVLPRQMGKLEKVATRLHQLKLSALHLKLINQAMIAMHVGVLAALWMSASFWIFGFYSLLAVANFVFNQKIVQTFQLYEQQNVFNNLVHEQYPSEENHPTLESTHKAFNHIFSAIVDQNNQIWLALREHPDKKPIWVPIQFPSSKDQKIISIQLDGENLMVRVPFDEEHDEILYKKVLAEEWKDQKLAVTDLRDSLETNSSWFTLPFISMLYPRYYNKPLLIHKNHAWAMSHGGELKEFTIDRAGRKQSVWGVTTVLEFMHDCIIIHDPYVPPHAVIKVPLPPNLEIMDYAISSSMLFLLGRSTVSGELEIVYRILDYDQLGLNPAMRKSFNRSDESKRVYPCSFWQTIDLSHANQPKYLTVNQIGQGDTAVEIRYMDYDQEQAKIYFKSVEEDKWQKQPLNEVILTDSEGMDLNIKSNRSFVTRNLNAYSAQSLKLGDQTYYNLRIKDFDERSFVIPIIAEDISGTPQQLYLCKHINLIKATIGLDAEQWYLICPSQQNSDKVEAVDAKIKDSQLFVKSLIGELNLTFDKQSDLRLNHSVHSDFTLTQFELSQKIELESDVSHQDVSSKTASQKHSATNKA